MRRILLLLVLFILLLVLQQMSRGMENENGAVNVDPLDTLGRAFRVTYTPPSTSIYATSVFPDTVYCAVIAHSMWQHRSIVVPMQHSKEHLYTAEVLVPDSIFSLRVEICLPTDRLPDGIAVISMSDDVRPLPGAAFRVWSADSALRYERSNYPWNYLAYYHYVRADPSRERVDSCLHDLLQAPDTSFIHAFTLSLLFREIKNDASEIAALHEAALAFEREPTLNAILYDESFWYTYYRPAFVNGKNLALPERFTLLAPLAQRFPMTPFARVWLRRLPHTCDVDTSIVRAVIRAYASSNDVDVLYDIASLTADPKSSVFDLDIALDAALHAERSADMAIGFHLGENIYGSMGRADHVRAKTIAILSAKGDHAAALEKGRTASRLSTSVDGLREVAQAYAAAAKEAGDDDLSERVAAVELPTIPNVSFTTVRGLTSSLEALRGKIVVLDFWFLGCAGCAIEHESLNEFARSIRHDSDVVFLSVALNDATTIQELMRKHTYEYDVVPNGQAICKAVGVTGFPTHVIIDAVGKTVLWQLGGSKRSGDDLAEAVRTLRK